MKLLPLYDMAGVEYIRLHQKECGVWTECDCDCIHSLNVTYMGAAELDEREGPPIKED